MVQSSGFEACPYQRKAGTAERWPVPGSLSFAVALLFPVVALGAQLCVVRPLGRGQERADLLHLGIVNGAVFRPVLLVELAELAFGLIQYSGESLFLIAIQL